MPTAKETIIMLHFCAIPDTARGISGPYIDKAPYVASILLSTIFVHIISIWLMKFGMPALILPVRCFVLTPRSLNRILKALKRG